MPGKIEAVKLLQTQFQQLNQLILSADKFDEHKEQLNALDFYRIEKHLLEAELDIPHYLGISVFTIMRSILDELKVAHKERRKPENFVFEFITYITRPISQLYSKHVASPTKSETKGVNNGAEPTLQWSSDEEGITFLKLLVRKNSKTGDKKISPLAFAPGTINFNSSIEEHAAWLWDNILSLPYPDGKPRTTHGMPHAVRVAHFTTVLLNLYRYFGETNALAMTEEHLKLAQLAGFFHDTGREADGADCPEWEQDSALLLYFYLTKKLGVSLALAKSCAEVIVNKENEVSIHATEVYWKELNTANMKSCWDKKAINITKFLWVLYLILRQADIFDVKRAVPALDKMRLNFVKDIVYRGNYPNNYGWTRQDESKRDQHAFDVIHLLCLETRSILVRMGDDYLNVDSEIIKTYESRTAYSMVTALFYNEEYNYRLLPMLYKKNTLLVGDELKIDLLEKHAPYDPSKPLDTQNVNAAMHERLLYFRGVPTVSAIRLKPPRQGKKPETLGDVELRKIYRRTFIPTETKKEHNRKQGNPCRSVSLLYEGTLVYASAGYLIANPSMDSIRHISSKNRASGRHKKKDIQSEAVTMTAEEKRTALRQLQDEQQLKTTYVECYSDYVSENNEITMDIENVAGIVITTDHNRANRILSGSANTTHPNSPLLQGIFHDRLYQKKAAELRRISKDICEARVPFFEYSGLHRKLKRIDHVDSELKIVELWREMCSGYLRTKLKDVFSYEIFSASPEDLKILSMYGSIKNCTAKCNAPADTVFDEKTQSQITANILADRPKIIDEYIASKEIEIRAALKQNPKEILSDKIFFDLIRFPKLLLAFEKEVIQESKSKDYKKILDAKPYKDGKIPYDENLFYKLHSHNQTLPLVGKKLALQQNKELMQFAYKEPILRIYELSKGLKDKSVFKKLHKLAIQFAKENIKHIYEQDKTPTLHSFENLICFVASFDLYDDFKDVIDKISVQSLRTHSKDGSMLLISYEIEKLSEYGILNPQHKAIALDFIERITKTLFNKKIKLEKSFDYLRDYLKIANVIGISKEKQKIHVLHVLKNYKEPLHSDYMLTEYFIKSDKSGLIYDLDIFKQLLLSTSERVGFDYFRGILNCILSATDSSEFTKAQLYFVEARMLTLAKEFVIHEEKLYEDNKEDIRRYRYTRDDFYCKQLRENITHAIHCFVDHNLEIPEILLEYLKKLRDKISLYNEKDPILSNVLEKHHAQEKPSPGVQFHF